MISAHPFLKGERENFGRKHKGGIGTRDPIKGGHREKGGLEL